MRVFLRETQQQSCDNTGSTGLLLLQQEFLLFLLGLPLLLLVWPLVLMVMVRVVLVLVVMVRDGGHDESGLAAALPGNSAVPADDDFAGSVAPGTQGRVEGRAAVAAAAGAAHSPASTP
mmetsp:Transcript_2746/g.7126  ORF Transcript_2746/g.7126 Transcript_2746/m.7126 type:complete len:119 (-) Transcript_2746:460-816(-)